MFELPDGTLFIAANNQCMIFNWRTNVETRLPGIPNGVRVTLVSILFTSLPSLTMALV
jgi:hypothetical protein